VRDDIWAHPDLVPTADDLDEPIDFVQRVGAAPAALEDPIAELERTEQAERERREKGDSEESE
jgi:hypothetical protein